MAETIVEQAGFPFSVEPGFAEFESDADWRSREILSSLGRVANFERPNDAIYEIPEVQLPWAARVQDLSEEDKVQLDFAQGLGALVVGQAAERPSASSEPSVSIVDQLEWAANGDRAALEANVSLALVEAILSEGVNEVQIEFDQDGEFSQGGHRLYDVLKNTIEMRPGEHPVLHDTTRTEGLGLSTMKMLETEGYFDAGYVWIVPRMVPQGVPASALREYGYFENLAVSWGIVWKDEDGAFVTRTLFTAGANPEDHEESATRQMTDIELDAMIDARLERRHDIQAV